MQYNNKKYKTKIYLKDFDNANNLSKKLLPFCISISKSNYISNYEFIKNNNLDFNDIYSASLEGLTYCMTRLQKFYNIAKKDSINVSLSYIFKNIRAYVNAFLHKSKNNSFHRVSFDDVSYLLCSKYNVEQSIIKDETLEIITKIIYDNLDIQKINKDILYYYFIERLDKNKIGKILDKPPDNVSFAIQYHKKKLAYILKNMGYGLL